MKVDFTLGPLNVETMGRSGYKKLIDELRSRLAVRFSHGIPVLAVQHDPPTRFFDLILRTNRHFVRFRFRSDNLYLLGYVPVDENNNPLNQWLEFDHRNRAGQLVHLITELGTNFLGFEGRYDALERAANPSIQKMRFGVYRLRDAIDELAVTQVGKTRAYSLAVVIMMISEATRLIPVFDHMAQGFDNTSRATERRMEKWITELVHNWESMSEAFLRAEGLGISLGLRFMPMEIECAKPVCEIECAKPVCCAKPSENFSVQKNKEVGGYFLLGMLFGACFLLGLLYGNFWIRASLFFIGGAIWKHLD